MYVEQIFKSLIEYVTIDVISFYMCKCLNFVRTVMWSNVILKFILKRTVNLPIRQSVCR